MMINLQTNFAGLTLKNPLIAASSGLTNNLKKIKELENAGIGAVVLKSLFEEQIDNHSEKLMTTSDYPEAADYINQYVEMNHMDKYLDLIRSVKQECSIPVIASINCYKLDRWSDFAESIQQAGADALELNVFLLNSGEFCDNYLEDYYLNVIRELKKNIHIPVIVKMAKNVSNLPKLAQQIKSLDGNGIVLFNRFYQPDIDIESMEIVSGSVFSNPADFGDTLRWTAIISSQAPNIDIACSNGVHSWEDCVKGILAGATAIELCSIIYENGPEVIGNILTCMEAWMEQKQYYSLEEFRGKLNFSNVPGPAIYERVQFMKYFSNYNQ